MHDNQRFFNKDPEIQWIKILCPVCGAPTGPQSTCYLTPKADQKKINTKGVVLPIYSQSCVFRQDNIYEITTNYPISLPLVTRLSKIPGIEKLIPTKAYSANLAIGKSFIDNEVKAKVNQVYRSFIKEMSVLELNKMQKNTKEIVGIKLPNGKEVIVNNANTEIEQIISEIPNSTPILNKDDK